MKWIVIWIAVTSYSVPCPSVPALDEYSGTRPITYTSCLVNHTDSTKKDMMKLFETKEEALLFIENAPTSNGWSMGTRTQEMRLGEIKGRD